MDALLEQCLDEPATDWKRHIDELCAAKPEAAAELRRRFEKLIALGLVDPAALDDTAKSPERVGHFRLVRALGGGGMGVVYEAHDEKLDRRVALKLIRGDHLWFPTSRRRFFREMNAASRLDHPNLCPIYEAGEIDGVPYLAMRFVDGETLSARLARRRGEPHGRQRSGVHSTGATDAEDIRRVETIARALHMVHEAGLVHRDVKPSNIMVARSGEPVLVDFGLARDANAEAAALTVSGERLGTPAYMAPEQVTGNGSTDRRADVYALGATLYECLTLRTPFGTPSRHVLYQRIANEPVPNPRRYNRRIGSDLRVVIEKVLAKDPADRFATAELFADELGRILDHEPIHSRRPSLSLRALRWCQRNRAAAGILAATALGLVASLVLLRATLLSEQRLLAIAFLQTADEAQQRNPKLAFRYARHALLMHDDPEMRVMARVQELMFELRENTVIDRRASNKADFSPDGRSLVVSGPGTPPILLRRRADGWRSIALDTDCRGEFKRGAVCQFTPSGDEFAMRGLLSGRIHRFRVTDSGARTLPVPVPEAAPPLFAIRYDADASRDRFLAVYSECTELRSRRSGELIRRFDQRSDRPKWIEWLDAAFLPGGEIVAEDRVWSADGSEVIATLSSPHKIDHVLVARDNFVTGSYDNRLRSYAFGGAPIGELLCEVEGSVPWRGDDLEVFAGGSRILARAGLGRPSRFWVLDARSLEILEQYSAGGDPHHVRVSPDGRRIAIASETGEIRILDIHGTPVDSLRGHEEVMEVTWSPRGDELVSVGGHTTRIWSFAMKSGVPGLRGLGNPDMTISPSGHEVIVVSDREGAFLLGDAYRPLPTTATLPSGIAVPQIRHVDEDSVVVGGEHTLGMTHWTIETNAHVTLRLPPQTVAVGQCPPVLLADGTIVFVNEMQRAHTWRPATDQTQQISNDFCTDLALSPDGTRMALCGEGGVRIRSTIDWSLQQRIGTEGGVILCARWSRDGRFLLIGALDKNAYLYDTQWPDRAPVRFPGHQGRVCSVAFGHDHATVAAASTDGTIRVWSRDPDPRPILHLRHEGVRRIAFTRAGRLVSAGSDGTVRWWCTEADSLRNVVAAIDLPGLTRDEITRVTARQ